MQDTGFELVDKIIGDCTYGVPSLGFVDARKILTMLTKVAGATFGAVGPAGETDAQRSARVLGAVLAALDDQLLGVLCDTFAKRTKVALPDGRVLTLSTIIDTHFKGKRLSHFPRWLLHCLEVTFGDFFGDLGSLATELLSLVPQATATPSTSPPAATGPFGDSSPATG